MNELITFQNIDPDDIQEVLPRIGRSFGVKFSKDAFLKVGTFGDLCSVIESTVKGEHRNDCTSQQAFYRWRSAITEVVDTGRMIVKPETRLDNLIPPKGRRRKMRRLRKILGVKPGVFNWLTNRFTCTTVGEAANIFMVRHYKLSRREPNTVNRQEIVPVVQALFADALGIEPAVMTPDARIF